MTQMAAEKVRLTSYSHGAGCGCKIAPGILEEMLSGNFAFPDKNLLVGNSSKDDAAVYDLGNGTGIISTTDFFMPIVDDPFQFGRIAAANSISDIYAMGGKPIMAIAVLGWPINLLPPAVAREVLDGGRSICSEAGIALAGGHSIDSPEPIFGLAVTGTVDISKIKQNNTAKEGDLLLLTKRIGVGMLTTAEKRGLLLDEHIGVAAKQMMQLNKVGQELGNISRVHAMTDVTGFGIGGHLVEMAEGSGLTAELFWNKIPLLRNLDFYISKKIYPGANARNWNSYGMKIDVASSISPEASFAILPDPQTNGGLLISVSEEGYQDVKNVLVEYGLGDFTEPIGRMTRKGAKDVVVK
jgi:selenide,water dikinase